MTGVNELRQVQVVSAAPQHVRVSVFGGRTQLDVALPLDVPVAGLVPDLARFVRSRENDRDDDPANKDERRTFWVLSRFDSGAVLPAEQTLREAGVGNGELLRLSSRRALSPPTLYDDVVDAVGRLNKAAHVGWNARSARWMAFGGVHLAVLGMVYCLLGGSAVDSITADRVVTIAVAGAVTLALIVAAAIAQRSYGLGDVAAALGWAAMPLAAGILLPLLARYGDYGLAAACGALIVLYALFERVIGGGHSAYLAAAVALAVVGAALAGRGVHLRAEIVFVSVAVTAALACLLVRRLTAGLGRFATPTVDYETRREEYAFENPFASPTQSEANPDADSGSAMPTAEEVWSKAKSAALTRAALSAGLACGAAVDVVLLLRSGPVQWPAFVFALACSAVLALRGRVFDTWFERAALAGPAVVLLLVACALAQGSPGGLPVTGLGVLLVVALSAALVVLASPAGDRGRRLPALPAYAEYVAVGSLIPLALWVAGVYARLGS